MATIYSGKSDRNQLKLFFDLGSPKSYLGEPTVNLITDTSTFSSSFWNQQNGTIVANAATGPRGVQNAATITATNTDPYIYSSELVTVSTGTVTWSVYVKGVGSTIGKTAELRTNFTGTASGTEASKNITLTDSWQRVTSTTTVTTGGTIKFGLEAPNGAVAGDVMQFADPQFEQNNHATQFTEGTRTASLVDLAGNNTFDISEVSYNEEGNILFNGTSDHIQTGNFSLDFGTGSFTLEAWVYPFANNTYAKIINKGQSGAFPAPDTDKGYSLRFLNTGATFSVTDGTNFVSTTVQNIDDVPANKWSHIMGVVDRATGKQNLYINGELNNSDNITYGDISIPSAELTIGSLARGVYGSDSEWFAGQIRTARIYGRALKPTQVLDNYKTSFERVRTQEAGIVQAPPAQVTPPPTPPAGTNDNYLLGLQDRDYLAGNVPSNVGALNWSTTPITISFWISPDWESGLDMPITGYQSADRLNTFWIAWNNKNSGFFARFVTNNQLKASWRQRWWNPYRSSAATGVSAANGVWSKRNLGNTVTYGGREWIHLVLTHDPNQSVTFGGMDLYWNGQKLTSTFSNRNGVSPNWTSDNFALGAVYSPLYRNNEVPFEQTVEGGLDQYRLYDRKLTEPEITALFDAGIADTNSLYGPIYEVDCEPGANPELSLNQTATFQQH